MREEEEESEGMWLLRWMLKTTAFGATFRGHGDDVSRGEWWLGLNDGMSGGRFLGDRLRSSSSTQSTWSQIVGESLIY